MSFAQKYWSSITIALVIVILFCAGLYVVETLPPRTITMATGAEGGANYEFGLRYRDVLARSGIKLQLLPTAGGVENLSRLRDAKSGISVAFVQGGTTTQKDSPDLESLGTISYEPLWLFYRTEIGETIQALRGRRVSIGPEGSGTRMLALELLKRSKLEKVIGETSGLTADVAAGKLIARDIDAAFIVSAWDSPAVQRLINTEGIAAATYPRADAYIALYPFMNKLILPAGVVDLLTNRPPADVVLLATKASLVVRSDLHPAIQYVLLDAAVEIYSQPGIFQKAGQFPAAESIDLPLSDEAQRFYKRGRSVLQKYLPFWLATLIERLLVVFLPLMAVLYPILRFTPSAYDWFMRTKIIRLYDEMKLIESEMDSQGPRQDGKDINARLDRLEQRANRLNLPTTYASALYTLRSHIGLIRNRLRISPDKNLPRNP